MPLIPLYYLIPANVSDLNATVCDQFYVALTVRRFHANLDSFALMPATSSNPLSVPLMAITSWRQQTSAIRLSMCNGAHGVIWRSQSAPRIASFLVCDRERLSPNPGQSSVPLCLKELMALVLVPFPSSRCLEVDRHDQAYHSQLSDAGTRMDSPLSHWPDLLRDHLRVLNRLLYRHRSQRRVPSVPHTGISWLLPIPKEL